MVNLPEETGFPQSVIDLVSEFGQPKGGWPKAVQKVNLGKQKNSKESSGASAQNGPQERKDPLVKQYGKQCTDDDLFCSVMYPQVFKEFQDLKEIWRCFSPSNFSYFHGLVLRKFPQFI